MKNLNILERKDDEYHTQTDGINPNNTVGGSDSIILDVIADLTAAREEDRIITSLYLEFISIDNPDKRTIITYIPDGVPDN